MTLKKLLSSEEILKENNLFQAIHNDQINEVRRALEGCLTSEEINTLLTQYASNGLTAVMMCAQLGRKDILDFLISLNLNLSFTDSEGYNVLDYVIAHSHIELLNHLLNKYPDKFNLTLKNAKGESLLISAVARNKMDMIKHLVSLGVSIEESLDLSGNTVLHYVASYGHVNLLLKLLAKYHDKLNLEQRNNMGEPPLFSAIRGRNRNQLEMIGFLTSTNNIPTGVDKFGNSVLHAAALADNPALIDYFLEKHPQELNLNLKNNYGETPILLAPRYHKFNGDHIAIIDFLVRRGASILDRDKNGNTVLHIAALHNRRELFSHLLKTYPELNLGLKNFSGDTPLFLEEINHQYLIDHLVEEGFNATELLIPDEHRGHLVDWAVTYKNHNLIDYLMKKFIFDLREIDTSGLKALKDELDLAINIFDSIKKNEYDNITSKLNLIVGSIFNTKILDWRDKGKTPLERTLLKGNVDIATALLLKGASQETLLEYDEKIDQNAFAENLTHALIRMEFIKKTNNKHHYELRGGLLNKIIQGAIGGGPYAHIDQEFLIGGLCNGSLCAGKGEVDLTNIVVNEISAEISAETKAKNAKLKLLYLIKREKSSLNPPVEFDLLPLTERICREFIGVKRLDAFENTGSISDIYLSSMIVLINAKNKKQQKNESLKSEMRNDKATIARYERIERQREMQERTKMRKEDRVLKRRI